MSAWALKHELAEGGRISTGGAREIENIALFHCRDSKTKTTEFGCLAKTQNLFKKKHGKPLCPLLTYTRDVPRPKRS